MEDTTGDIHTHCSDFLGRDVHLGFNAANHIAQRHPEMASFLDRICDVLTTPDLVYRRPRVGSNLFYKLGVLTGTLANTYMVVVVRYNEKGSGEVRTAYPTTRPVDRDELIHIRPTRGR